MRHIKLDKGADGVAILTLDNADESMNVVSAEWLEDMNAAIAELRDDESVTGVIIVSGKKAFMAGAAFMALAAFVAPMAFTVSMSSPSCAAVVQYKSVMLS